MAKKITQVEMHDGFFIPGVLADKGGGQFGKSLPPMGKTLKDLEMELNSDGSVSVEWGSANERQAITIGAANIKYVKHAPKPKENVVAAPKSK